MADAKRLELLLMVLETIVLPITPSIYFKKANPLWISLQIINLYVFYTFRSEFSKTNPFFATLKELDQLRLGR